MSAASAAVFAKRKPMKELADGTYIVQVDVASADKQEFYKAFPEIDLAVAVTPVEQAEGFAETAVTALRKTCRELSAGDLRVSLEVPKASIRAFMRMFFDQGTELVMARMDDGVALAELQRETLQDSYGQYARALMASGFLLRPDVWRALGDDGSFLSYVTQQGKCEARPAKSELMRCNGDIVAAHVRRVANGAGTGIKPPYSAIPLCDRHHGLQHAHGESCVGGKDHFDKMRIKWLAKWAKDQLKDRLSVTSMKHAEPAAVLAVCEELSIERWLPREYAELGS